MDKKKKAIKNLTIVNVGIEHVFRIYLLVALIRLKFNIFITHLTCWLP